jgi:hypothetical protein
MHWTTGRVWSLPAEGEAVVGALATSTIALDDRCVSRRHATMLRQPGGRWLVVDQSRNGTKVNGQRVHTTTVDTGDLLEVGDTQLLLLDRVLVDAVPTFDALLGTSCISGYRPTSALLHAIASAPRAIALVGPHRKALEFVAAEVRRVVDLPLRWGNLQPDDVVSKLASVCDMSETEARKHTLFAAAQDATSPTDPRGPWTLVLCARTKGAQVVYAPFAIHIPVRGIDERPDDRTAIAARIYAARPDLHPFLSLDELTRVLSNPKLVNIAEAWEAAARLAALAQTGGNVKAAAALLGEPRSTLDGWLERHGVEASTMSSVGATSPPR